MAGKKVRGITIELGADYTQVTEAFTKVTKQLSSVDKSLNDVNKLLKLDPSNVELLTQKQGYLEDAIALTAEKLLEEQRMLEAMPTDANGNLTEEQKALSREIESTKIQLDKYQKELDETTNSSKGMQKETKGVGDELNNAGKEASTFGQLLKANLTAEAIKATAQAVMEIGKQMWNLGKETAAYADDIMTLSTQYGIATDTLQEYKYMAELTDTSLETITGSMTKLTKNMATASKGTGDAYNAFKALGISITDSNGELRNSEVVFNEAITALGQMENETQKDAYAMQIFGKSAMDLNPLIAVGADGIAEYAQEAHNMGYVLDSETLESLGELDDAMQRSQNAIDSVMRQVGTALAPVIADITQAFAEWAQSVDWQEVGARFKEVMGVIGRAVEALMPIFRLLIDIVVKAIDAITKLFTGKFQFPKIKLPHFRFTGSLNPLNWLKEGLPKISVDWYAKGYDGMVLDGATIFGINNKGQLMGGGEKGREIIIGENKLKSLLNSGGNSYNIVINEASNPEATAKAVMNQLQLAVAAEGRTWK